MSLLGSLLEAEAIAAIAASIAGFGEIAPEGAAAWIAEHGAEGRFFPVGEPVEPGDRNRWIEVVDGAKLMEVLFSSLSEARVAYDKVKHGFEITQWLIEHRPEALQEIAALLAEILPS